VVKNFLIVLVLTILTVCGASSLEAQQVTCTPSVTPELCKKVDSYFGPESVWPKANFTKGVEIVIVDPSQFKAERAKWDAGKEMADRHAKTVGDINRAHSREAGEGVFGADEEILECPHSSMVERIVISTSALNGTLGSVSELSDHLVFYVIGYDEGLMRGMTTGVP
jgi:hypothetical protein